MNVSVIAECCHEANRVLQRLTGEEVSPHWEDAPEWMRESIVNGVLNILNDPDTTPEESHQNWLKHREMTGWVYGKVKDEQAKTHPCMVSYDQLPDEQRIKDEVFRGVVLAFYGFGDFTHE